MIFVIGGAYQGKREFVMRNFGISPENMAVCTPGKLDFSKPCIVAIEEFTRGCLDPVSFFAENRALWQDKILIMEDIFCGVVPMGEENRTWRQNTGRLSQYLSREAERVSRIFCGLELRLK